MRRRVFLSLIFALCLAGFLLLVGCGSDSNVGTSVLPGLQTVVESSSSNQSASQDTTTVTPDETNEELTDLPTENTPDHSYVNTWYDFPDWGSDFTPDRFISLERFAWHLEEAGNSFSLISTDPIKFTNGYVVVYILHDALIGGPQIRTQNLNGSNDSFVGGGSSALSFQIAEGNLGWLLAEHLWIVMDIGDTSTDTSAFWASWHTAVEEGLFYEQQVQHNELLTSHQQLEKSEMDITSMPPLEWHNLRREAIVSVEAFNAAIGEKNANFQHSGGVTWSNGYLTIEILNDIRGWGIAIYDSSGERVEAFDNSGWYSMADENMTYGLANALWYTVAFCDRFVTMEPVLAEEALQDTFGFFASMGAMYPQR